MGKKSKRAKREARKEAIKVAMNQTTVQKNCSSTQIATAAVAKSFVNTWKAQIVQKYLGEKNKADTQYKDFIDMCKMSQMSLKQFVYDELEQFRYRVYNGDGFVFAPGEIPVMLVAHLDTVHSENVKDFYEWVNQDGQHQISSPQGIGGDDRCGVYIILEIIKRYKPYVLFCEDEEIGCIGADKFVRSEYMMSFVKDKLNFIVEFDRKGHFDAVYYDCDNDDFEKFVKETCQYSGGWGSMSDISTLAPAIGVAAVNLSSGYYNAHTVNEYVIMEHMFDAIEAGKKLLEKADKKFEYIESKRYASYGYGGWHSGRYDDYDDVYGYSYENYKNYYGNYSYGQSGNTKTSTYTVKKDGVKYCSECGELITGTKATTSDGDIYCMSCYMDLIEYYDAEMKAYYIEFYDESLDKIECEYISARSEEEAVGMLMRDRQYLKYNLISVIEEV